MSEERHEQFAGVRERALEILERGSWGDIELEIGAVEVTLALLCEATRRWLSVWEDEVSPAFDEENGIEIDEFELTREQVHDLGDSWRLAYVARLVETLGLLYGVTPGIGWKGPGRSPEGDITPPAEWANDATVPEQFKTSGIAQLLQGLNDLLDTKRLDAN